ncbi:MAG: metallophosphoesterase [Solirubrobacterales bacterium]|nr:metallophosphoesterase [Solirubrobacterales bacterium]
MRTVVISDLHLGGRLGVDILRNSTNREVLKEFIAGADRLVLLGDTLELRHGPAREAVAVAMPILTDLASVLGKKTEVVIVGGNHDHAVVSPLLDARRREQDPIPLTNFETAPADSGWISELIEEAMKPAKAVLGYPCVRINEDVVAFHGNYLDRHISVPTFERLAAGVMSRITGRPSDQAVGADDYEAVLAPMYAWAYELAQQVPGGMGIGAHGASTKAWKVLAGGSGHKPIRKKAAAIGFAGAVGLLNTAKLGPLRSDISPEALRKAGIAAAGEAVAGLGLDAKHVLYGHTHRAGPLPTDMLSEWMLTGGQQLWNTGSWVFEQHFLSGAPQGSSYWPGRAIEVIDEGAPVLHSLLNGLTEAEIVGNLKPNDQTL